MNVKLEMPATSHAGIIEHFTRAALFYNIGMQTDDSARYRLHIAAIYSCRAIAEMMFEEADRGRVNADRGKVKQILLSALPFFNLVERIRIHDFHRVGLVPPDPNQKVIQFSGPVKLKPKGGQTIMSQTDKGFEYEVTGESSFAEQRSLVILNEYFFDEDTQSRVTLSNIIREYLVAVPHAVDQFQQFYPSNKPS